MINTTYLNQNSRELGDALDSERMCNEIEKRLQKILLQIFSESSVEILWELVAEQEFYKINLFFDIRVLLSKTAKFRYPKVIMGSWRNRRHLDTEVEQEQFINHMVDRLACVVFKREFGTENYQDILKVINYIYSVQKDPVLSHENNLQIDGKLRFYNLKLNCNDPSEPYVKGLISNNTNLVYKNRKILPEGVVLKSFRCTTNNLNLTVKDIPLDSCDQLFYWNHPSNIRGRSDCKFHNNKMIDKAWAIKSHW